MRSYEKLATLYAKDWGAFSKNYMILIDHIIDKYNIKPKKFLDIACGTGNLANEISDRGFEVKGIDISESMINVAKNQYPNIQFQVSDMCNFNMNEKFDVITCAFDPMNYLLERENVIKAFGNIREHLNEDGVFIFDINTNKLYEEKHSGVIERTADNIEFKQILNYDLNNRIATTTFDFGNGEVEVHTQKGYTQNEISELLIECGFKISEMYSNLKFDSTNEASYKVFYVVSK